MSMLNRNGNENHVINEKTMAVNQEDVNVKLTYGVDEDVSMWDSTHNIDIVPTTTIDFSELKREERMRMKPQHTTFTFDSSSSSKKKKEKK